MTRAARERSLVRTPILIVTAAAWILMAALPDETSCCAWRGASLAAPFAPGHLGSAALSWAVMLVAMMLPLLAAPVRHVRDRSFAQRRGFASALFLAGYAVAWTIAGAALLSLAGPVRGLESRSPLAVAGVLGLLAAWQASPLKQACLNGLHAHPELPAFGFAADAGALRFGLNHGAWCVGSCWGLMLLPMILAGPHVAMMIAVSLWVWGEGIGRPAAPRWAMRLPVEALRYVAIRAQMFARSTRARLAA